MQLKEIADELKITTEQLRQELEKTNFGISPSAQDINDALAKGVIRFLKGKIKPTISKRRENARVAIIMKSGAVKTEVVEQKNEEKEEKKTSHQRAMTKKEREALEEKKSESEAKTHVVKKSDSSSPDKKEVEQKYGSGNNKKERSDRTSGSEKSEQDRNSGKKSVKISRRIELGNAPKASEKPSSLPHNYYKKKKKGRRNKKQEEVEFETIQRHPGKVKIAKVRYDDEEIDERDAAEIEFERQQDKELFRAQKKHRATSQKSGHKAQPQIKAKTGVVEIPSLLSLKEFSEKCGLPVAQVITTLFNNGVMATINQMLDFDTASLVAAELGVEVVKKEEDASSEDLFEGDIKKLLEEEDKTKLKKRPPVISIMGHVDHGKTSLLDTIRNANVIATESGGITQHIGAYQVKKNGELITFLDTPGHEAFTSMRARGAKATDIAILVVAADDGVKPQTIEAINHAKEAGIPIIVAINKIDKPDANPDNVKSQLVEHGLQAEDWGGKTIMVPVSALKGDGIDDLLEMILLVAQVEDLKANPDRLAVGTVIEAHLDKSLGPVATVLVNTGTLRVGDSVVVGTSVGKIKAMHDHTGKSHVKALPSAAVRISGLKSTPHAGDLLQAFRKEKIAKERAEQLKHLEVQKEESMSGSMVERIVSQINKGDMKYLKLVLKADAKGSLEAIMQSLNKIKGFEVAPKIIHFGVGNISNTDVIMASASQALLLGFHVSVGTSVQKLAERHHLEIKNYEIIYKLIEDMKAILSGMLEPEINIIELGKIELKEIFLNKKTWIIGGGRVKEGKVEADSMMRLVRDGETVFETELESLKHVKEDVKMLEKGSECGFKIKTPEPVLPGDVFEVFKIEKIERTLD